MLNRSVTSALVTILATSIGLAGCAAGPDGECPDALAYERAALEVDKVVSAEFECEGSFGSETEGGTVVIAVDKSGEAPPVIEEIYRSFAADPGLIHAGIPYSEFVSEDGKRFDIGKILDELGFGGVPSVSQMREKYGITPSPTSSTP